MDFSIKIDPVTLEKYMAVHQKGKALLSNPFTNKGPAFTEQERDQLGLHGLLPPSISSIEEQLSRNYENFAAQPNDLEKFTFLSDLHDRNETLFFRFLHEHIEETIPIVYTPTVGEACQKFSHIYRRGRGLYISYLQIDRIEEILSNYYFKDASVIVVTDGERILGLGDQGADGMGIPIGKLCLYTLCAGVAPYSTLPIMLDVGTDNEDRRNDQLYLGLRRKRIRGEEYQKFIDKFVDAVRKVFPGVLLQWEDLLKANAIKQMNRFKDVLCSFNDDIQGTGSMVLSCVYNVLRITGQSIRDSRFVISGAGAAAHGIANLIALAVREEGVSLKDARKQIWMVDSKGLVTKSRSNLEEFKTIYARETDEIATYNCKDPSMINLEETIANSKPAILIGTSATPGIFSEAVVRAMAKINERPVIFPLSNPTSKSECTPEQAIRWSDGRAIVATGSPFPPVEYGGRRHEIGQCNNSFIFPGFGLGVMVGRIRRVTDYMFLAAAKALSGMFSVGGSEQFAISPELRHVRECSHAVACAVIKQAVSEGHADEEILNNLEATVKNAMWFPEYVPARYEE
jgi:malate dehydrogenase (oxaloacetate-decarboxylating)